MNRELQLVMGTANAYIQSPGLLRQAGDWIGKYGKRLFVVTGKRSWNSAGERLTESLERAGLTYRVETYRGECSYEEVARMKSLMDVADTDLVVGVGGGKVTDLAKALSHEVNKPFVSVPTLAATCAPVANLAIMYTEEGVYIGFPVYLTNTLLVLVDTEVIAAAPARYLASGIGDTLAKWYESNASSSHSPRTLPTTVGLQLANFATTP